MKQKILLSLLLLFAAGFLKAQSLQEWTWSTYKIKFQAPDNMRIQENDASVFSATNDNIALSIYPRKGENLTYDGMKQAIKNWAYQENLNYDTYNSDGDEQPIYLKDLNGYWGCAIDGTNKGFPTSMLLLVDPDYSDISFCIWTSYSDQYYHDVLTILKSFKPM